MEVLQSREKRRKAQICLSLASLAVDIRHVVLVLPEPGLDVSAEGEDLAELGRGVVIKRVNRDSAVKLLDVITPLQTEVVHFVVNFVLLLKELLDVLQ